ncbi:hypothetical protein PR048_009822 [Dryococelus australis]|uniref:Uncharacterized protein n=1 Tax=Dryococelus australis TaxID=614101 RepID=A0ABQ9I113_9NEOP|nr:hypothetical protein PR048_009822 [Dryococelus australis]
MKGRGKRQIPENTRQPTASSGTIPTCENPVTRPGIEPGSPWWEARMLIAQPQRPPTSVSVLAPHLGESGSIPGGVTPRFLHVGIMTDDDAGRRVFWGISRFPCPFVPALLDTRLASPSSALKASIQFHQNILASSLDVSESLAGERRPVTPASLAAVDIHGIPRSEATGHGRIVPGRGGVGVIHLPRRRTADSVPAAAPGRNSVLALGETAIATARSRQRNIAAPHKAIADNGQDTVAQREVGADGREPKQNETNRAGARGGEAISGVLEGIRFGSRRTIRSDRRCEVVVQRGCATPASGCPGPGFESALESTIFILFLDEKSGRYDGFTATHYESAIATSRGTLTGVQCSRSAAHTHIISHVRILEDGSGKGDSGLPSTPHHSFQAQITELALRLPVDNAPLRDFQRRIYNRMAKY